MNIRQVTDGKEDYIELLRMGDPDESRIRKVLEEGELFLLEEHGKLRTLCVVIFSEEKKCEIKNIVTIEKDRGKGYGRYMIHYICEHYCSQYDWGYMKKDRCRWRSGVSDSGKWITGRAERDCRESEFYWRRTGSSTCKEHEKRTAEDRSHYECLA